MMKKFLSLLLICVMTLSICAIALADEPSGTVMIYSSAGEDVIIAIKKGFEAKYPGVTVDYYSATSGKCVTKLAAEFEANAIACDVFWPADFSTAISFKNKDQLVQYVSPNADHIADQFKDPDGYFTGARMLVFGFTWSTLACTEDEIPSNFDGLLDKNFDNQILMSDPTGSASTKALVYALTNNEKYGWDYFEQLKGLQAELESSTGAVNNKVASGSYKIAIGLDYTTRQLIADGSPLGYKDTEDMVAMAAPICIPVGAPHEELAKLLYDYILDTEGGQKILTQFHTTPVASGVELPEGMLDAQYIADHALPIDFNDLSAVSSDLLDHFDAIFKK
ncbi:MAG: ABC transporter substrate-binding protein [Clostridia bacterium]|nr:ABC transporter substrate-binding protein [Clostridia bacterium]